GAAWLRSTSPIRNNPRTSAAPVSGTAAAGLRCRSSAPFADPPVARQPVRIMLQRIGPLGPALVGPLVLRKCKFDALLDAAIERRAGDPQIGVGDAVGRRQNADAKAC